MSVTSISLFQSKLIPFGDVNALSVIAMSSLLTNAAPLKAEIRLAQAVSEFERDLSAEQKATFRTCRSQSCQSPPGIHDVMRVTAEIDRRACKLGGGRCFGPRFVNVLQAIQQFAAVGDVIVGGAQNIIACGVWSLVRMTVLVSPSNAVSLRQLIFCLVSCEALVLPREAVDSSHGCWSLSSLLPKDGHAIFWIQDLAIALVGILHRGCSPLSPRFEVYPEVLLAADGVSK